MTETPEQDVLAMIQVLVDYSCTDNTRTIKTPSGKWMTPVGMGRAVREYTKRMRVENEQLKTQLALSGKPVCDILWDSAGNDAAREALSDD